MAKFRSKPYEVEAVQWNGDNMQEVIDFIGDQMAYHPVTMRSAILVYTKNGILPTDYLDWIIRTTDGRFRVVDPEDLAREFDAI